MEKKSFPSAEKCLDFVSRWWMTPQLLQQGLDLFSQNKHLRQRKKIKENTELEDYQYHPTARISTMRGISGTPNL